LAGAGNILALRGITCVSKGKKKDLSMVEERIVEVERPSGGGAGWMIAVVLVIALVVGILLFVNNANSGARKDNAIAAAAGDVGKAATKAGEAAETAANKTAPAK
jgi:flagellar biosynthesis/type III secretory pathway M-ring protein FliF/YscJ